MNKYNICILNNKEPELINLLYTLYELHETGHRHKFHVKILCDGAPSEYQEYLDIMLDNMNFEPSVYYRALNKDFAAQRQYINDQVNDGEFIIFLDSDENVHCNFFLHTDNILLQHPEIDALYYERENLIYGVTEDWLKLQKFVRDEKQRVNFPDIQLRTYKKTPNNKWISPVHEALQGTQKPVLVKAPDYNAEDRYVYMIKHHKIFIKQKKQNNSYEGIERVFN